MVVFEHITPTLLFLFHHNLNEHQKEGENSDEDEQVAEDEKVAANVEGVPQAQPQLLHLGNNHLDHLACSQHPGDGLTALGDLADLALVVVDHPTNEGNVVHQVIDGHHNLHLKQF